MTAQCPSINNALNAKGLDNAQLAAETGIPVPRVDAILLGADKPSQDEYNKIASALGLSGNSQHASQVTA